MAQAAVQPHGLLATSRPALFRALVRPWDNFCIRFHLSYTITEVPDGLSLTAASFLRIHAVRVECPPVEQWRENWLNKGMPAGVVERAIEIQARWGGLVLPRRPDQGLHRRPPQPRPARVPFPLVTLAPPPPGPRPLVLLQHPPRPCDRVNHDGQKEVTACNHRGYNHQPR